VEDIHGLEPILAGVGRGLHDRGRLAPKEASAEVVIAALGKKSGVLPRRLERDDILRGFLYGSESLVDLGAANTFLQNQNTILQTTPNALAPALAEVAELRYQRFAERLTARLNDLQATGQPELPRLVGHTLRLLNLLRDAWTQPANSPPPALEIGRATNGLGVVLHGEPYAHYNLAVSRQPGPARLDHHHDHQLAQRADRHPTGFRWIAAFLPRADTGALTPHREASRACLTVDALGARGAVPHIDTLRSTGNAGSRSARPPLLGRPMLPALQRQVLPDTSDQLVSSQSIAGREMR